MLIGYATIAEISSSAFEEEEDSSAFKKKRTPQQVSSISFTSSPLLRSRKEAYFSPYLLFLAFLRRLGLGLLVLDTIVAATTSFFFLFSFSFSFFPKLGLSIPK